MALSCYVHSLSCITPSPNAKLFSCMSSLHSVNLIRFSFLNLPIACVQPPPAPQTGKRDFFMWGGNGCTQDTFLNQRWRKRRNVPRACSFAIRLHLTIGFRRRTGEGIRRLGGRGDGCVHSLFLKDYYMYSLITFVQCKWRRTSLVY